MEIQLQITDDGSHTLYVPELNEHYHSTFGAIQESRHVFLSAGFDFICSKKKNINLLEVGFGTGLNALLTVLKKGDYIVNYTAIEAFPLDKRINTELNYPEKLTIPESGLIFHSLHDAAWEKTVKILPGFMLKKIRIKLQDFIPNPEEFDLVYFDAFAPDIQPELWTAEVFRKLFLAMVSGGVLVTYSAKGLVKQNLKAAGFSIERLTGPPGKRHMLRAEKYV
ncbi:MAG: tRNA (5-methylaminomethyl-2-thiouridine)(34)-methyltransferase MnmD [Bacteroidales bacterium]|nr:tRNA (5-methylaminomethyl-2-thiouridine)(34)-methyltransferase MnmD [Bacteroidales bacterium]